RQNGSGGTDHGHASCLFVLGGPVNGGKIYGQWPGLAPEQLYEGRDLALTTDFRDVFAEVPGRHLGASNLDTIFPSFRPNPTNFRGVIRALTAAMVHFPIGRGSRRSPQPSPRGRGSHGGGSQRRDGTYLP